MLAFQVTSLMSKLCAHRVLMLFSLPFPSAPLWRLSPLPFPTHPLPYSISPQFPSLPPLEALPLTPFPSLPMCRVLPIPFPSLPFHDLPRPLPFPCGISPVSFPFQWQCGDIVAI